MQLINRILISLAASALGATAQSGCGQALPSGQAPGQVTNVTIQTTISRWALFSIPPNYNINTKTQAIISFHGATKDATEQLGLDGLTDTSVNTDKIIVYPNSIGVSLAIVTVMIIEAFFKPMRADTKMNL